MRRILFPAPATFDLFGYEREVYIDEILTRTQLMMGTFDSNLSKYGIVDSEDPSTAYAGGTRPLSVSVNTSDDTTVDIYPGTVVFKSGEIIHILSSITQVELANSGANGRNVIYLEFGEEESDTVATRSGTPTNSKVIYYTDPADYVKVLDEDDYDALDPADKDLTVPLALVTVQVVSSGTSTTNQLEVDMERTTFTENRPWFSVVDAEHRSYIGTGVETVTNPHALSYNDISATASQTLFQLLLNKGMIVAKERSIAGIPGTACSETIPYASVYTDDASGTVTGIPYAYYFVLSRFPIVVLRATDEETETFDYAPSVLPGKNLVYLLPNEEYNGVTAAIITVPAGGGTYPTTFAGGETLELTVDSTSFTVTFEVGDQDLADVVSRINIFSTAAGVGNIASDVGSELSLESNTTGSGSDLSIDGGTGVSTLGLTVPPLESLSAIGYTGNFVISYDAVEALEPPSGSNNIVYPVVQPATKETVIAGGVILSSIASTELTFEDAGQIPAGYHAYVDEDGIINRYPQTVFCTHRLNDIGYSLQNYDTQMKGNAKLRIGLTGAAAGGTLSIKIELTGKDTSSNIITEEVVFGSSWTDSTVPSCAENNSQWVTTTNIFSELTSLIVTERLNDGPLSAITVQAMINPVVTDEIADVLPVAYLLWDGLKICEIIDERPINTEIGIKDISSVVGAATGTSDAAGLLWDRENTLSIPNYAFQVWSEDFNQPTLVATEVVDTTTGEGLAPVETAITKSYKGLGPGDIYVSKPIAITPNTAQPNAFRFIPIKAENTFDLKVRYYKYTSGWTNWVSLSSLIEPPYTLDLNGVADGDIAKWQMYVTGEVQGMIIAYLASELAGGTSIYEVTFRDLYAVASTYAQNYTSETSGTSENLNCGDWSSSLELFIIRGANNTVLSSSDGETWSAETPDEGLANNDILWISDLGLFIAGGDTVFDTSPDGSTWTGYTAPSGMEVEKMAWSSSLSRLVVVGSDGGSGARICTSEDCVTFTPRSPDNPSGSYVGACWAEELGKYYICGEQEKIESSSDGINWTLETPGTGSTTLIDIVWNPVIGKLICVGNDGQVYTSSDGSSWDSFVVGTVSFRGITNTTPGMSVAVNNDAIAYLTYDGIDFKRIRQATTLAVTEDFNGVAYGDNRIIMVGDNGMILASLRHG